jgi:flagellar basal-body rod protein FlgG
MIRSLWIAKTGLDAQQTNLDVIANNLANASTTGFKRIKPMFEDLLYQSMRAPGSPTQGEAQAPSGLTVGVGVRAASTERINVQGSLSQTANPLDVAINGNGFFQITMPDGSTAYTRDGNFSRDSQGQMVTSSGYVVAPGITIPAEATGITISEDGKVSISNAGSTTLTQVGQIQLVNFANPAGMAAVGSNLMVETPASGTPNQGTPGLNGLGSLRQYFTEASNVNIAEELVSMIQAQRGYEINTRAIKASDEMLQRLSQL